MTPTRKPTYRGPLPIYGDAPESKTSLGGWLVVVGLGLAVLAAVVALVVTGLSDSERGPAVSVAAGLHADDPTAALTLYMEEITRLDAAGLAESALPLIAEARTLDADDPGLMARFLRRAGEVEVNAFLAIAQRADTAGDGAKALAYARKIVAYQPDHQQALALVVAHTPPPVVAAAPTPARAASVRARPEAKATEEEVEPAAPEPEAKAKPAVKTARKPAQLDPADTAKAKTVLIEGPILAAPSLPAATVAKVPGHAIMGLRRVEKAIARHPGAPALRGVTNALMKTLVATLEAGEEVTFYPQGTYQKVMGLAKAGYTKSQIARALVSGQSSGSLARAQ